MLKKVDFIKIAERKYKDKFNYSKVPDEVKSSDLVTIGCPKHGDFTIRVVSFLISSPHGCQQCSLESRVAQRTDTTESFIQKAREVHGDKYDYSKVTYANSRERVTIICPKHGEFQQEPHVHIAGHQCPKCGYLQGGAFTFDDFLQKAKAKFGNKYDYRRAIWINTTTPIEIICPKHGSFWQKPFQHYAKAIHGCPKCSREADHLSGEQFLTKAKQLYGSKFNYCIPSDYQGSDSYVEIECPTHGLFRQRARIHLMGSGCTKCSQERQRMSIPEFIQKAHSVHGNRYDYSLIRQYKDNKSKLPIKCGKHGVFWMSANSHLRGSGCPRCINSRGEEKIARILDKYSIRYEREYRIANAAYEYDFYLPDTNILIEYDGLQHYVPIKRFGGKVALERTRERDAIKNGLAKRHKYFLIRISYRHAKDMEEYLIHRLKCCYKYWFRTMSGDRYFRNTAELMHWYNIPKGTQVDKILDEVKKQTNLQIIF